MTSSVAFLAHASEDKDLARRIAISLLDGGIPTFFDEWEIRTGDSIRQKIDQGLLNCTQFLVLLTEHSITKPWVNVEVDGAFAQKVEGKCQLLPLRFNLPHQELPPTLKALRSLEITMEHYEDEIKVLVADIFGISQRPPLGPTPELLGANLVRRTGLSEAALRIAQHFVLNSEHGDGDPQLVIGPLRQQLSLTNEDAVDGTDELERMGAVTVHRAMTGSDNLHVSPLPRLFARFDTYWKDWTPDEDAVLIAARLLANRDAGMPTPQLAREFDWPVRRLNPALSVLLDSNALRASGAKSFPEIRDWVQAIDETRRFVKRQS